MRVQYHRNCPPLYPHCLRLQHRRQLFQFLARRAIAHDQQMQIMRIPFTRKQFDHLAERVPAANKSGKPQNQPALQTKFGLGQFHHLLLYSQQIVIAKLALT